MTEEPHDFLQTTCHHLTTDLLLKEDPLEAHLAPALESRAVQALENLDHLIMGASDPLSDPRDKMAPLECQAGSTTAKARHHLTTVRLVAPLEAAEAGGEVVEDEEGSEMDLRKVY